MSYQIEIISPQKLEYKSDIDLCIVPGVEGDIGILSNHTPFVTTMRIGIIYVYIQKKLVETFLVTRGVLEFSNNKCTILTEEICKSSTITSGQQFENDSDDIKQLKKKAVETLYYS